MIAKRRIGDIYRRCGGFASRLGSPTGKPLVRNPDGSYSLPFSLGTVVLNEPSGTAGVIDLHRATVQLSAVKCFGTDDEHPAEDEPYLIFSIVAMDPNQFLTGGGAVTSRTEIVNKIRAFDTFLTDGGC